MSDCDHEPGTLPCPCGSGLSLGDCCGPLLSGRTAPATAEALMRSRFTAFVRNDQAYLLSSWHGSTRPASLDPDDQPRWHSLRVLRSEDGGPDAETGLVEFMAEGMAHGRPVQLHEVSRFVREHGRWQYLDGRIIPADRPAARVKTGRNDPCPCGSGRKFKKCCGR